MIIKSFGCSFIFGTDLHDDGRNGPYATPSQFTWPALIAQKLGYDYQCRAKGGAGNLFILDRILQNTVDCRDEIFLINWTYIDRFDYGGSIPTVRGGWESITPTQTTPEAEFYYRHFHSEFRDKLTSLIHIKTAVDLLLSRKIPFVMTNMDTLLLSTEHNCPTYVHDLQQAVAPYIHTFEGQDFLNWSHDQGFEISATKHPLESAHAAAADVMLPVVQSLV